MGAGAAQIVSKPAIDAGRFDPVTEQVPPYAVSGRAIERRIASAKPSFRNFGIDPRNGSVREP
jgi:hypothetical protein